MSSAKISILLFAAASVSVVDATYCDCGYYCPDPIKRYKAPVICPVGSYCPKGKYNATSFPVPCTAGRQCPTQVVCTPLPCPCGSICPEGSSAPIQTKPGTYSLSRRWARG